jgi:hypothetical protein
MKEIRLCINVIDTMVNLYEEILEKLQENEKTIEDIE